MGLPPVEGLDTPAPVISGITDPAADQQADQEDPNA